jgi:hypothetical protein
MAIESANSNVNPCIGDNTQVPVPPVPPVPATWPPAWLAEPKSVAPVAQDAAHGLCGSLGWRLSADVVVCARCHPQPAGATPVKLVRDAEHGLRWQDTDPQCSTSTLKTETVSKPITSVTHPQCPPTVDPTNTQPEWL